MHVRSSAYIEALQELDQRLRSRVSSSYTRADKNDRFASLSPQVSP